MYCILNVTDEEFDKIMQLNSGSLAWMTDNEVLLEGLETLVGADTVRKIRRYEECRMEKHDDIAGMPRVEPGPASVESTPALVD